jgi:hypothetical protein
LELAGEVGDMASSMFSYNQHLPQVCFGLGMTFESIFVSTLFLADLAVPAQALQAFRFHLVCNIFGSSNCFQTRSRQLRSLKKISVTVHLLHAAFHCSRDYWYKSEENLRKVVVDDEQAELHWR